MSSSLDLKIHSFIKKNKLLTNAEASVFMRFTFEQQRVEFGLNKSIVPKFWDAQLERVSSKSDKAYEINSLIDEYERKIRF